MNNNALHRQMGIIVPSNKKIRIIGAGGIGSATAFILAKMGFTNITVYDFDEVEEHNTNSQFYGPDDLGKLKVDALKENILRMTGVEIEAVNESVERFKSCDIVIFAVDSMDVRIDLFKKNQGRYGLLIDGRMGGEIFNIYSYSSFESMDYEGTLYPSSEADHTPCTAKAISYNVYGLASLISNIVKRYDKGEDFPRQLTFSYPNMVFHTSKTY